MIATVMTIRTRHIGDSTPCINNQRKLLRRSSDVKPRRIIPVREEIIEEIHASIRKDAISLKLTPKSSVGNSRREREGQEKRWTVVVGEDGGRTDGGECGCEEEEQAEEDGGGGGGYGGESDASPRHGELNRAILWRVLAICGRS